MSNHIKQLNRLGACRAAVEYAQGFNSLEAAWQACERSDWMFWLIGKRVKSDPWSDGRKPLLACALDCAEITKHLWPEKQKDQITEAVSILRSWIDGNAAIKQAIEARNKLYAVAVAAYATDAYAAYAAYAADAADAAYAAAAADAAADVYAAVYAAAADADADAVAAIAAYAVKKQCADIVRKYFPNAPNLEVI